MPVEGNTEGLSGSFGKGKRSEPGLPSAVFHANALRAAARGTTGDSVLCCWVSGGEAEWGSFAPERGERQQPAPSRLREAELFHRAAPDCSFHGSGTELLGRNCTWTRCAEKQEKAYNLRSTLTVLKAFSATRNTKFSVLLVEKCTFGGFLMSPEMLVSFVEA